MTTSYQNILAPQVLTEVVRQVVASGDAILNFMGMQPGGVNEMYYGHGRNGVYHVYDDTRKPGKGRSPGTPAGRSSKQNMKAVPFVYPRMHDSVSLLAEFVHNLGRIDDPAMRDVAGRDMIMRQANTLSQKATAWRVGMVVGMLKDQLYVTEDGDDWYISYNATGSAFQIQFGVPAGNKGKLNMTNRAGASIHGGDIIDATWSTATTSIINHIAKINQARANVGVGAITDIHLDSQTWQYVANNNEIAAQAGTSSPPYTVFQREVGTRPDGSAQHEYIGRVNSLPGINWHISDEGLDLWDNASKTYKFSPHWPTNTVVFMGSPTLRNDNFTLYQGSEPIAEYDGGPETVRAGLSAWSCKKSNPTATELFVLDNCLPVNHDGFSVAIGDVS